MGTKKVHKPFRFTSDVPKELTETEIEVLHYLTTDFLTPLQIAIRRHTGIRAVQYTIQNLKEKGAINRHYQSVRNFQSTVHKKRTSSHKIRLHGEEYNINILFQNETFKGLRKKANTIIVDGNTVRLYRNSIEVYSGQVFYGDTASKADYNAIQYWNRFFIKLENKLSIIIIKQGHFNISRVNQHYAEINNELAEESNIKGNKIRIYAKEDGKLWFTIDNSFNLNEAETLHPETAKQDMGKVQPFFQDLRQNNPPKPSEIWAVLAEVAQHEKELAAGLNTVVTLIKAQYPEPEEKNKTIPDYLG